MGGVGHAEEQARCPGGRGGRRLQEGGFQGLLGRIKWRDVECAIRKTTSPSGPSGAEGDVSQGAAPQGGPWEILVGARGGGGGVSPKPRPVPH